jgi:hypothetical protein
VWSLWKARRTRHESSAKHGSGRAAPIVTGPECAQDVRKNAKPQLVEEGKYYGRPVRLYSDGSVKAATRKGWMKFANMDALQVYVTTRGKRANTPTGQR